MPTDATPATLPDLDCACATIRRTARLVTQLYSQEMGPNIEPPQFALLSAFQYRPGIGQTQLARALGLDKTTLSRNLRLMQRNGWITPAEDSPNKGDRKGYGLTPEGERILAETRPGWMRAQEKLRSALVAGEWDTTLKTFGQVAQAARKAMDGPQPLIY